MKILHTSDWHLGHTLYGYDRREEQFAMLQSMTKIVASERPDAMLICGDIFDVAQPAAGVQRMFVDAIGMLHDACPGMIIVATAGNHDSATRHEVFRKPWESLNVYCIGTISSDANTDANIIEIPQKGWIVAIPYIHERNMPEGYIRQLLNRVAERNTDNLPVILTGHTTVRGADFIGHSDITKLNEDTIVGGIESIDINNIGKGYDYFALGHIHRPQYIHTGRHNVRYSGSPLPVSFDEDYKHTVGILEIDRHFNDTERLPDIREIQIHNPRPLITIPANGFADWPTARQLLIDLDNVENAYIRLNVEIDGALPVGANNEAERIASEKNCFFCLINSRRKSEGIKNSEAMTVNEFQKHSPIEIARKYFEEQEITFDDEMRDLFLEAVRVMNDKTEQNEI